MEGGSRHNAALIGSKEIRFAVMAMTITLVAVLLSSFFMSGRVGQLFIEFALTVAAAVLVSGFVALTLTPMMCSKLLNESDNRGKFYLTTERFFHSMNSGYRYLLRGALRASTLIVIFCFSGFFCRNDLVVFRTQIGVITCRGQRSIYGFCCRA